MGLKTNDEGDAVPELPPVLLRQIIGDVRHVSEGGEDFKSKNIWVSLPIKTYRIELEEAAEGKLPSKTEIFVWRYLVSDESERWASIDLKKADARFVRSTTSSRAKETAKAIREAGRIAEEKNLTYELRLLEIPSLFVNALWLSSPSSELNTRAGEIFIPVADIPPFLTHLQEYSKQEFIAGVKSLAGKLRDASRELKRRSEAKIKSLPT